MEQSARGAEEQSRLSLRTSEDMERLIELMIEGCEHARQKEHKPVMITVSLDPYLEDEEDRHYNLLLKRAFAARGFPVFANLNATVKAAANLCRYSEKGKLISK